MEPDELEPPLPPPPLPDPSPEIKEAMRAMNEYANLNAVDLANDFEEYMGGKDKCSSDLMPREKFKSALGVLLGRATSLYQLDGAPTVPSVQRRRRPRAPAHPRTRALAHPCTRAPAHPCTRL